jgi:hypothetical protein
MKGQAKLPLRIFQIAPIEIRYFKEVEPASQIRDIGVSWIIPKSGSLGTML